METVQEWKSTCNVCGHVHTTSGWLVRLFDKVDRLSVRERDVFARMSSAPSDSELASQLVVSERTVRAHLASIRAKFGGIPRHGLVVAAFLWNGANCHSRQ